MFFFLWEWSLISCQPVVQEKWKYMTVHINKEVIFYTKRKHMIIFKENYIEFKNDNKTV